LEAATDYYHIHRSSEFILQTHNGSAENSTLQQMNIRSSFEIVFDGKAKVLLQKMALICKTIGQELICAAE
jgi:hypothetical protein